MAVNDDIYTYLARLGYSGAFNDKLYAHLTNEGFLQQSLTDKLAAAGGYKSYVLGSLLSDSIVGSLFYAGEQGVWYDPNDLTTLYQDSAGTTPVTAAGQPVGLMLDKRLGLVRGTDRRATGVAGLAGIAAAATYNTTTGNGSVTRAADANNQSYVQFSGLNATSWYEVTVTITSAGSIYARNGSHTGSIGPALATGSRRVLVANPSGGLITITFEAASGTATFTGLSIRELPGNHAFQATAASRPILRQTPILGGELVVNGSFDASTDWVDADIGTGASTISSGQLSLSGTAGNPAFRYQTFSTMIGNTYQIAATCTGITSGSLQVGWGVGAGAEITSGVTFTSAMTGVSTFTATATTTYIKALSASTGGIGSIDNISVREITGYYTDRNYLETDGVDDFMSTAAIDFTATDKASVFAGVRKLSDAASGVVCELGTDTGTVNGSFRLSAPASAGAQKFLFVSRGTVGQEADTTSTTWNAPITVVASGAGNISGDSVSLRLNGSLIETTNADQGAGNYGNLALYLFRRAGTNLPFNGHFYGLTIVGRLASATETTNVERIFANKTGVTLA